MARQIYDGFIMACFFRFFKQLARLWHMQRLGDNTLVFVLSVFWQHVRSHLLAVQ